MQKISAVFGHLVLSIMFIVITTFPVDGSSVVPAVQVGSSDYVHGASPVEQGSLTPVVYLPLVLRETTLSWPPRRAYLPFVFRPPPKPYRMGFGVVSNPVSSYSYSGLGSLGAGWYVDWGSRSAPGRPYGIEYAQMVRVHQRLTCPLYSADAHDRTLCPYVQPYAFDIRPSLDQIRLAAQNNPGSLWLIGNEMDRRDWSGGGQDEMLPETYAWAYHDLYHFIKAIDPHARLAIGGVIQATPLRLEYLGKAWDAYATRYGSLMPVDVWNVHNFILKERSGDYGAEIPPGSDASEGATYRTDWSHVDMDIFDAQIRAFRQWMRDRGQQNKPLIVSEYGVLYGHDGMEDPDVVQKFMLATFDYFLNTKDCGLGYAADGCRLVQRWAWYSLDDDGRSFGHNRYGALFDPNTLQITNLGRKFAEYAMSHYQEISK